MTDTTKTEALRLADLLESAADNSDMGRPKDKRSANRRAAAELRRLAAVEAERDQWKEVLWAVARALNCLPSTYSDGNGHVYKSAVAIVAERDRLRAALAASCDEERNQIWEAGPGGGCMRAHEAESERDRLAAECEALRADKSLVDWLTQHSATIYTRKGEAIYALGRAETVRSAITAAMGGKESQGGKS